MASVEKAVLAAERNAIEGTKALAKSMNDKNFRVVSTENLAELVAAYESVIAAMTNNSMKEFPDG